MTFKYYYCNVRARGSVPRYILDHAEADWEEIDIWHDKGKFLQEKSKWQEKCGQFVTTPIIEETDSKFSCSATMPVLTYLGEKFGS